MLIVDDPGICETVRRALNDADFTCANADLALRQVQERKVNLATLDLRMPGRSGIDLLRELKEPFF